MCMLSVLNNLSLIYHQLMIMCVVYLCSVCVCVRARAPCAFFDITSNSLHWRTTEGWLVIFLNQECFVLNLFVASRSEVDTEALVIGSKDMGLEINDEKTKDMAMSWDQNAVQNSNIKTGIKCFETVEQFQYLGTTIMTQNSIHEEIKSIFVSGNACCHLTQNLSLPVFYPKI
jgi:hypothetical protein